MKKTVIRRLSQNVDIKLWQIFLFTLGFILIIVGLVLVILWQRGLVQLRWLPCPRREVPIAYESERVKSFIVKSNLTP